METINKVRTRHLVQGQSISQIARDLNLSRNTVKKYLKDDYPLAYQREKQPQPLLGAFHPQLLDMLNHDIKLPVHHRRTAKRLFGMLQEAGYQGAYDSVQRAVKAFRGDKTPLSSQAFVPLSFASGEVCQFDWSYETVKIAGIEQRVKVAHFRLACSRQYFVVAYPNERLEMLLDGYTQEVKRVNSTSCINIDRNRYSVPVEYVNKVVSVHLSADQVSIYEQEKGLVARHPRCFARNQFIFDVWHYVPLLKEKLGAFRDGLPFKNIPLPEPIARVQAILMSQAGGDKDFIDLLLQIPEHGMETIEVVCDLVLGYGAVTGAIVHNELQRLIDKKQPNAIIVSEDLVLTCDPIADPSRYDSLYASGVPL